MSKWPLIVCACVLVAGAAHAGGASSHVEPTLRLAQAENGEFEATEPPSVTLEEPETLERTGESAVNEPLPEVPPGPPQRASSPPDYWDQESVNRGFGAEEGATGESAAQSDDSADNDGPARTLGRSITQGFIALCVVLALIALATYALKRWGARTPLLAGVSLGTVLGKVYLTPKIALHFVKIRNVVLVLGVTPNEVSTVARLDASLFDDANQPSGARPQHDDRQMDFLSHLNEAAGREPEFSLDHEDDEIAALKGDIARLQRHLQETSRELGD